MRKEKKISPKVLVLPSWFPSDSETTSGDFVERHIQAIEPFCKQYVIYVAKDEEGSITSDRKKMTIEGKSYSGEIIYYKSRSTGIQLIDKFLSDWKYIRTFKKAIREYIQQQGKPRLIHVHVAQKAGRLAVWAKRKWKLPYVVSEHWTGYLPEADLHIQQFPFWYRKINQQIIMQASAVTVVSEYLGKALQKLYPAMKPYVRIPNVVHLTDEMPVENSEYPPVLIHASTMSYQKNVEDILIALADLKNNNSRFLLRLFGPSHTGIHAKIRELGLRDHVRLEGNVPHEQLLRAMQEAKALIAYSRFETFGCVIIEAHAAGIPVLVSDIPVFHELVTENINGLFIPGEQPFTLSQKLSAFLNTIQPFNPETIKENAKNYSYSVVGATFAELLNKFSLPAGH